MTAAIISRDALPAPPRRPVLAAALADRRGECAPRASMVTIAEPSSVASGLIPSSCTSSTTQDQPLEAPRRAEHIPGRQAGAARHQQPDAEHPEHPARRRRAARSRSTARASTYDQIASSAQIPAASVSAGGEHRIMETRSAEHEALAERAAASVSRVITTMQIMSQTRPLPTPGGLRMRGSCGASGDRRPLHRLPDLASPHSGH